MEYKDNDTIVNGVKYTNNYDPKDMVVNGVDTIVLDAETRVKLWDIIHAIPSPRFKNGRTSAFWHMISTLESHLQVVGRTVKLDLDKWDVAEKTFTIVSYELNQFDSTGVKLGLADESGCIIWMVVPKQSIEWID